MSGVIPILALHAFMTYTHFTIYPLLFISTGKLSTLTTNISGSGYFSIATLFRITILTGLSTKNLLALFKQTVDPQISLYYTISQTHVHHDAHVQTQTHTHTQNSNLTNNPGVLTDI
jgi:hypothetical protein